MKTVSQLLSDITRDALCLPSHRSGRNREEINRTIRFASGISMHYAKYLNISHQEVLSALEEQRSYWSLNYYQKYKFLRINELDDIFETLQDFFDKYPSKKYKCPSCGGHSSNPQSCNVSKCDWKSFGLLGCLDQGYSFITKDTFIKDFKIITTFIPIERL